MRIPLAVDLHINAFNGVLITESESGITNGIVEKKGPIVYVTQRPAIDVFEDASLNVSDARGRAIYYWDAAADLYFINNDTIYKNTHASVVSSSPTAGTKKCKFLEAGGKLVLLDAENSQGFTITTGDVVTEITDVDFPPKQTPAIPLAYGGAVLDKYLFVLGTDGIIYNSAVNDPTTWASLDYLDAERSTDGGQYLGRHHDNVVVYGDRTIEFFYDATNDAGSPLSRRQDISYQIGCVSGESVWEVGDISFFVGNDFLGSIHVYVLENFGLRPISTSTIDSYLTQIITKNGYIVNGSGVTAKGHLTYLLTVYLTPSDNTPYITLAYDYITGLWGEWNTTVNDLTKFPLMDWSTRNGTQARYGEGILFNGDMITINENMIPQDTVLASTYVTTGYVQTGYVLTTGETGTSINLKVRTGQSDGGSRTMKTMPSIALVADKTENSQTMTIKWAKEKSLSFSSGVSLDTSKRQKITRIGSFERVNFELDCSSTDTLRLEALEGTIGRGTS